MKTRNIEIIEPNYVSDLQTYIKESLKYFKHLELKEAIITFNGWYYRLDSKIKITQIDLINDYFKWTQHH